MTLPTDRLYKCTVMLEEIDLVSGRVLAMAVNTEMVGLDKALAHIPGMPESAAMAAHNQATSLSARDAGIATLLRMSAVARGSAT